MNAEAMTSMYTLARPILTRPDRALPVPHVLHGHRGPSAKPETAEPETARG